VTADDMARLHALAIVTPRPWSAAEIAALLAGPHVFAINETHGFLLGRAVAGEAEVLTLAVAPDARRQGVGGRLLAGFVTEAVARGAHRAFLEVAADNTAAIGLYRRAGFVTAGVRRRYYRSADGRAVDALVMDRPLFD